MIINETDYTINTGTKAPIEIFSYIRNKNKINLPDREVYVYYFKDSKELEVFAFQPFNLSKSFTDVNVFQITESTEPKMTYTHSFKGFYVSKKEDDIGNTRYVKNKEIKETATYSISVYKDTKNKQTVIEINPLNGFSNSNLIQRKFVSDKIYDRVIISDPSAEGKKLDFPNIVVYNYKEEGMDINKDKIFKDNIFLSPDDGAIFDKKHDVKSFIGGITEKEKKKLVAKMEYFLR